MSRIRAVRNLQLQGNLKLPWKKVWKGKRRGGWLEETAPANSIIL